MTTDEADALLNDPGHFTKAVTDLGERQPLRATRAIYNEQGIKIAEQGAAVNARLYQRLLQHRLSAPLEESVAGADPVDAAQLREQAELQLLQVPLLARMAQDGKARAQLLDAVAKVPLPQALAFQLTLARELRHDSFVNAVRTALIAAWLSLTPTTLRFDMGLAAAAGLLHDVGMLHLDPVLLEPRRSLSSGQQRQLYSHPLVSTLLLERYPQYPGEVLRAVAEHHEFLDGSGYPRALAGEQISPLGRVLALAEVAAAMLSPQQEAAEMRLSVLLRMNAQRFDAGLVARVLALLRPHQDRAGSAADSLLLDNPVALLCEIDDTLAEWPHEVLHAAGLAPQRRAGLAALGEHSAQLQRTLANVGAARAQLEQLGAAQVDPLLSMELSLLARESAWQLRAMTRQARRRWRAEPQADDLPGALHDWLARAEAMVAQGLGLPAGHSAQAALA
jgi:hypothetical protein